MVWQQNDLAGAAGISCDIVPFRYSLSRGILVPFWELEEKPRPLQTALGQATQQLVGACATRQPAPVRVKLVRVPEKIVAFAVHDKVCESALTY
jgi:hypothetical protein